MKTIYYSVLITLLTTQFCTAQVDIFGSIGNVHQSNQTSEFSRTFNTTSRLVPDTPGKALSSEVLNTYMQTTEARSGMHLELGVGKNTKINEKWSYRLAGSVSLGQYNQTQQITFLGAETLSSDTINYTFPTGGFTTSTCDTTIFRDGTGSFESRPDLISIINLNITAGIEYQLFQRLSVGAGIFVRTPINSRREFSNTVLSRENLQDGRTACIFENETLTAHPIDHLSELRIALSPYFSMKLMKNVNVKVGANLLLSDTYIVTDADSFIFFNQTPSHRAIESYLQVSYVFGPKGSKPATAEVR